MLASKSTNLLNRKLLYEGTHGESPIRDRKYYHNAIIMNFGLMIKNELI